MKEPDFTIVSPSYNYAEYIREMLDSVVAQEGVSVEHLVYDAGSTDGSIEILEEYDHVDLTVEPDKGMSDAINKGFKRARGKWVMWLNTDDLLLPGALLKVKEFAEHHPDADVIHGGWNFVDRDGKLMKTGKSIPFYQRLFAHLGCYIASTATFYNRDSVLREGHLLNERFGYVMDGEFYNRLGKLKKKFMYFPEVLADFRVHNESLSLNFGLQSDINASLDRQLAAAESVAIRRTYGITLFSQWHFNAALDCVLFCIAKLIKQPLAWCNKPKK